MMRVAVLGSLLLLLGCSRSEQRRPPTRSSRPTAAEQRTEARPQITRELPSITAAPSRIVAVGDIHGDVDALRSVLRLAGAIDDRDRWIGGPLWVVQTGDLLDRGDQEDEVLDLVSHLAVVAEQAGGRFVALIGNHEVMNAQGDFRYVTREGFSDFEEHRAELPASLAKRVGRQLQGRVAAFAPGGHHARVLARRNTVMQIGTTLFAHGGLVLRHVDLDRVNDAVSAFFSGSAALPAELTEEDSPFWYRGFSLRDDAETCARLAEVLERVHATRMVVGHTVQEHGIDSACADRVWRIDVGLSRFYGGPVEALEIVGDQVRALRGGARAATSE